MWVLGYICINRTWSKKWIRIGNVDGFRMDGEVWAKNKNMNMIIKIKETDLTHTRD